jgi:hypothetical protein
MTADLFDGFDPATVAAVRARYGADIQAAGQARAAKRQSRHELRRATAEKQLAEILPARFTEGESWHVISHGDIDALSYLRHALQAVSHFDFVLLSTWCIAGPDLTELQGWVDSGRIDQLTLAVGEIFPSQYGDEYEQACNMADNYGVRLIVSRNHSKVILASNEAEGYQLVMEGSANVNTNPRIEQTAIHRSADLLAFYRDFYHGLRSIDKRPARATS